MLENSLIESALALTGKKMEDIVIEWYGTTKFSIEKFCYYLLSPEFIDKYLDIIDWEHDQDYCDDSYPQGVAYSDFGVGIGEYQKGNEQTLISLLEKI